MPLHCKCTACRYQQFYYYTRTEEGQQYAVHCRRRLPAGVGPPSENDVMDKSVPGQHSRVQKPAVACCEHSGVCW